MRIERTPKNLAAARALRAATEGFVDRPRRPARDPRQPVIEHAFPPPQARSRSQLGSGWQ